MDQQMLREQASAAMVTAYGGAMVLADVLVLLMKMFYYIIEAIYRLFVPREEKSVAGEIVLVTGAGHGIGKELSLRYASLGATVVCLDLNEKGNEETVKEIKKLGASSVHGYRCDVSNRNELLEVAEKVKKEVGDVTILVNNAGIMPTNPFLVQTPEQIQKVFDINVMAHFWTLQAFLPKMIEKNHGHVVALSSMAGIIGLENLVPYCATKFAVRGMMEALHEELRATHGPNLNVKFTVIYPYMVDTGLCKKPRIKFPSLMSVLPPKDAAAYIVDAQRRNCMETSIPGHWLPLNYFFRVFPKKVALSVKDFFDSGVEADC